MLKTPFAKAFYLCNSFILITTSFSANPSPLNSVPLGKERNTGDLHTPIVRDEGNLNKINTRSRTGEKIKIHYDKPQMTLNKKGMLYVKKYIRNRNENLVSVKKRSRVPFYIIDSVFNRYGLPVELKYLAVIESELKPSAQSRVGAMGPWQFMPGTAHILGLKVNRQCDERSNYYKSTIAAAKYLRDLYALFDDWLLVLAAYNGGPRPVYTAIHKSGSRNFWVLQKYLPAESREHVKKFIATHYYFEGRGSETTLTRAENVKFKTTVKAFAKTLRAPLSTQTVKATSVCAVAETTSNKPFLNYDFNQIFQSGYDRSEYEQVNAKDTSTLCETPEQKFSRLMKESEESLKNCRKII